MCRDDCLVEKIDCVISSVMCYFYVVKFNACI